MLCTPLYPMVLLIIIPIKNGYFIGNINPTFSDKANIIPNIFPSFSPLNDINPYFPIFSHPMETYGSSHMKYQHC